MDRYQEAAHAASPPSAPAANAGYPTNGNPQTATPASEPGEWWFHMVTEELRAVITAAGLTPNHADLDQVLEALPAALASRPEMARSLAAPGYQKLPGGLIIQWGVTVTSSSGDTTVTYPVAFPNAARSVIGTVGANTVHVTFTTAGTTNVGFLANAISVGGRNAMSCSWLAVGN